ncbi:hypothetical protein GCM10022252_51810 [Streptosporangium oxazolinicum]|uniref:Uncharacterized protein n=1 Tax=Streptosporangium oxazolinicum TaxID=909287 RepID=A0ABP8B6Y2_9ACTN
MITRRSRGPAVVSAPPAFWPRERTGEQSSARLFLRHEIGYLRALSGHHTWRRGMLIPSMRAPVSVRGRWVLPGANTT